MLAPPQRTIQLCGESWTIRPPRKALDVLEATVYQYARFAANESDAPASEDMRMVCAWLAEHVVESSACDAAQPMQQAIDTALTWPAMLELREEIIDLASIDSDLIEGLSEYWRVGASGGCECPRCKDGKEISEKRLQEFCLYERISKPARHLAGKVVGFTEDPDPSQPYWLFQLKQARLDGKLQARAQAMRRREEGEKIHKLMKERGVR